MEAVAKEKYSRRLLISLALITPLVFMGSSAQALLVGTGSTPSSPAPGSSTTTSPGTDGSAGDSDDARQTGSGSDASAKRHAPPPGAINASHGGKVYQNNGDGTISVGSPSGTGGYILPPPVLSTYLPPLPTLTNNPTLAPFLTGQSVGSFSYPLPGSSTTITINTLDGSTPQSRYNSLMGQVAQYLVAQNPTSYSDYYKPGLRISVGSGPAQNQVSIGVRNTAAPALPGMSMPGRAPSSGIPGGGPAGPGQVLGDSAWGGGLPGIGRSGHGSLADTATDLPAGVAVSAGVMLLAAASAFFCHLHRRSPARKS